MDVARVSDCPVCLGTFKDPRFLPCGHTFCLGCITQHGRSKGSDPDCPNCRTKFQIPSNGFEGLPKNYCLNPGLDKSRPTGVVDMSKAGVVNRLCKKHNEELILYCVQCTVVICLDCMERDHRKHDCCKISGFAKEARTQLEDCVSSITPILSQVKTQKYEVEEESEKFRNLLDKSEFAINEECDNIIHLVNRHRSLLLEELSNEKQRVTKDLKTKTDEIETEQLSLTSFKTGIEEMLQGPDEATTFDIVYQYKDLKESFDKLKQIQPQAMGQVSITGIEFIPGDFKDFISRRGNMIGRLQKESASKPKVERNKVLRRDLTPSSKEGPASDPLESVTYIIQNFDQDEMEKQMSATERDDVQVTFNDDKTFRLEGVWLNVETVIEQLKDLINKKLTSKNTTEENKELTSNNCDETKLKERNLVLQVDLTLSSKQVDLSLSQRIPIDQHVWYYLKRKHKDKLDCIATQHLCISRVVCESSNEGITHSLEVVPYALDNADEAKKHVDDAVEEFCQLYQKVSEPGIVKESIKLPLIFNQVMPQQLIAELEEVGVFFLRSDDPCLIGPKASIEEAKQKLVDFISGRNDSPAQTQPNDGFSLAQALAADDVQPMTFKTPSGLAVRVSKGELEHQSLDAIVNPANEYLSYGDGASRVIAKAAGDTLQRECKDFIRKYGKLGITRVIHTSAGNLRPKIKYVMHAVGPRKSDAKEDEGLFELVKLTIFNCLCYANDELKIHSIAIPAICSGIFGVPIEIVGRASFEALKMFDSYCASCKQKCLHEIHFLNSDETTFSNVKRIFQSLITPESTIDPKQDVCITKALDRYATAFGLQRIETTPDDCCFARAFATALQIDFQSKLDWRTVRDVIRREQNNNKDYYETFRAFEGKRLSLAEVVENTSDALEVLANSVNPMNEDEGFDLDVSMNAAANALEVHIVLVLLSEEKEPVEQNFQPKSSVNNRTVFIAFYYCGHHHFDALVQKYKVLL